jgi:hypothetical protein
MRQTVICEGAADPVDEVPLEPQAAAVTAIAATAVTAATFVGFTVVSPSAVARVRCVTIWPALRAPPRPGCPDQARTSAGAIPYSQTVVCRKCRQWPPCAGCGPEADEAPQEETNRKLSY